MSSFYEKLAKRFQSDEGEVAGANNQSAPRAVTYSATGDRTTSSKQDNVPVPGGQPANDAVPDGSDPIDADLFQSDSRMVVFMQVGGVAANAFEVTASEESNTLVIEAVQKRPALPVAPGAKEGDPPEKGIYVKSEVKWKSLYRKIYLPASFDGSGVEAMLDKGVLVITLPAKRPGVGKKLQVREIRQDEQKK